MPINPISDRPVGQLFCEGTSGAQPEVFQGQNSAEEVKDG